VNDDELSPSAQAEIAALKFETNEKDRWLKLHSFVYRHEGAAMMLSFALIIGCILSVFIVSSRYTVSSEFGEQMFYVCMVAGWSGIILLLFTYTRPNAANWWRTLIRTLLLLTIAIVIIIPAAIASEWLTYHT